MLNLNKFSFILLLTLTNLYAQNLGVYGIDLGDPINDYDGYLKKMGYKKDSRNKKELKKANVLTVDTRDQKACHKIAHELFDKRTITKNQYNSFCVLNEKKPMISLIGFTDETIEENHELTLRYSELTASEKKITTETRNFAAPATALMALFFAMPTDQTGWEEFTFSEILEKYNGHISEGPKLDKNQWAYNWIGHPYTGAVYYSIARHAGLSRKSSLGYSFLMSTFYWEYGFEAIAEVPSIQDLIITPLLGAALGEAFLMTENLIKRNNNQVLGSNFLGSTALFVLNPTEGVFNVIDNMFHNNPVKETEGYFTIKPREDSGANIDFGIRLLF